MHRKRIEIEIAVGRTRRLAVPTQTSIRDRDYTKTLLVGLTSAGPGPQQLLPGRDRNRTVVPSPPPVPCSLGPVFTVAGNTFSKF